MKIGDYVRYKDIFKNEITKIRKLNKIIPPDEIIEENYYYFNDKEGTIQKNIIKSSPNIIDLIEEHDLLKLYDIEYGEEYIAEVILEDKNMLCVHNYENSDLLILEYEFITNEHIELKSIVTKEQFDSMEYKVGD